MSQYETGETNKTLIVAPIILIRNGDYIEYHYEREKDEYLGLYIGLVPADVNMNVVTLEKGDWKTYLLIACTLVFSLILTGLCIFQISHSVIKPLRVLNSRMREILES